MYLVLYLAFAVKLSADHKRDRSYGVYLYGWPVQQLVVHAWPSPEPVANAIVSRVLRLLPRDWFMGVDGASGFVFE